MRIAIVVEYDGTEYCGWQIQPNGNTVQAELERAVEKVTGKRTPVTGSGRTDAGVHALGQVAHFDTDFSIPPENFAFALNAVLPKDIKVIKSERAKDGFHARFSAKKKTYAYKFYVSDVPRPLKDRYFARVPYPLDFSAMKKAAEYFVGEHDFRCFLASNSSVKDTIRTVYSATIGKDGEDYVFTVSGNGFLYNMVRIMVGTLIKAGTGKIKAEEVGKIIESGDRSLAGATMPPQGLTLLSVEYTN